ncbi:lysophospholipid acyltransferase family protein [Leptospira sp. GIMC2001]|uniref:lysophospholipid acyltransferase family protein n=1 Tax=Leptospira sp. GIMC2001 TaxID=1513297 RepID=UPI00234B594E|nr:lauroyl acyltransferase [Leptospira sp. GIMC2001]WCL49830.1 lauroyl acyltransferase [Leptospira sp. GIMC2001]
MKKIEHIIGYLFIRFIFLPFQFLPYEACLALGRMVVRILAPLAKSKIKIARENIEFAFPNLTEHERQDILKKHLIYLGEMIADSLYAPRIDDRWLKKYFVYENGAEELDEKITKEGLGVVMISGHFGTWEVLVHWLGLQHKGLGIYKKMRNPWADRWYRRLRENSGIQLVPTIESAGPTVKGLKKGRWVGFGADQNAGKSGIFVQFMNRPASTFQGPALMAYLTGAKMILISFLRGDKDKKVHVHIRDLGVVDKDKFPDRDDVVRYYTQMWTQALEEEVRKTPEQYFWVHRRWKTKPGDFEGQV